jgi:hypothetical protein
MAGFLPWLFGLLIATTIGQQWLTDGRRRAGAAVRMGGRAQADWSAMMLGVGIGESGSGLYGNGDTRPAFDRRCLVAPWDAGSATAESGNWLKWPHIIAGAACGKREIRCTASLSRFPVGRSHGGRGGLLKRDA